jgi:hypothetical protein
MKNCENWSPYYLTLNIPDLNRNDIQLIMQQNSTYVLYFDPLSDTSYATSFFGSTFTSAGRPTTEVRMKMERSNEMTR